MWFAPQLRALFQHRNSQRCSEHEVFLAFWLRGVLHATPACKISSLIWPDGSWLRTRRFREPTFRPSGATNHWKTKCYATFLPFARLHLFSSDSFCSLIFFLLLLSSLTLPTSAFSSVHIVGSLASKLPSIIRWFHQWTSDATRTYGQYNYKYNT